jgi:hypothetical protein
MVTTFKTEVVAAKNGTGAYSSLGSAPAGGIIDTAEASSASMTSSDVVSESSKTEVQNSKTESVVGGGGTFTLDLSGLVAALEKKEEDSAIGGAIGGALAGCAVLGGIFWYKKSQASDDKVTPMNQEA